MQTLHKSFAHRARQAFTLIELLISVSLMALLLLAMTRAGESASRLFETSVSRVTLEQDLRLALGKLRQELELASLSSFDGAVAAPGFGTGLTFDRVEETSDATGTPAWRTLRVELRYADGETDDGTDEDGDGVIDEGQLVMVYDPDSGAPIEVVLCRHVRELFAGETANGADDNGNGLIDERGFALTVDGSVVDVRLCLEGLDADRRVVTRSLSTAIRTRN